MIEIREARLVEAAIAAAGEQGMDEIDVGTETDNLSARGFYKVVGFGREYLLLGRDL